MALTLPRIPNEIPCPEGDIFNFPTAADLTNLLNEIGDIPNKLRVWIVQAGDEISQEVRDEINEVIKTVEEWREKLADLLSPYWNKGLVTAEIRAKYNELIAELVDAVGERRQQIIDEINQLRSMFVVRDWQRECRQAITEFIQELHIYVPMKVAELISKITSFSFKLTLFGITIDVLKIATREEQERIKMQICEKIDFLYNAMPEAYQTYDGTFGVDDERARCQAIWSWFKSEIQDWLVNGVFKLIKTLIKIFKVIWKALGLPDLSALFEFDVAGFISAAIGKFKDKINDIREDLKKDDLSQQVREALNKQLQSLREQVCQTLESLNILGFGVLDLLGGEIRSTVRSCDETIQAYIEAFRDFAINWKKKLLFDWIKIIKKFFDKIGLGSIFKPITITFCDILRLIGFDFSIPGGISAGLAGLAAKQIVDVDDSQVFNRNVTVRGSGTVFEYLEIEDENGAKRRVTSQTELDTIQERAENVNVAYYKADGQTDTFIVPGGKGNLQVYINNKRIVNTAALGVTSFTLFRNYIRFAEVPKEGDNISLVRI
jgi:uncharacterized coiled-coil DUF342 family protein